MLLVVFIYGLFAAAAVVLGVKSTGNFTDDFLTSYTNPDLSLTYDGSFSYDLQHPYWTPAILLMGSRINQTQLAQSFFLMSLLWVGVSYLIASTAFYFLEGKFKKKKL